MHFLHLVAVALGALSACCTAAPTSDYPEKNLIFCNKASGSWECDPLIPAQTCEGIEPNSIASRATLWFILNKPSTGSWTCYMYDNPDCAHTIPCRVEFEKLNGACSKHGKPWKAYYCRFQQGPF